MANVTGEEDYTSKINQALNTPPAGIAEFFSALNIFLAITAGVGNVLILIALKNVSSIYPPTKLFFRCLAVTDLCVCLILHPLFTIHLIFGLIKMNVNVLYYVHQVWGAFGMVLCGVSVLTSTAISVDRLLALFLGLRYRHVVTLRRVRVVVTCVWLTGATLGVVWVWKIDVGRVEIAVVFLLCLATSVFCYIRIHLKLRQQQVQVQNNVFQTQPNGGMASLNITRYRKTVSSIMWVQLALVACYVPWGIAAVLYANGIYNDVAWFATITLLYLNSSLNPFLYCWRIREVKQTVKGAIRQLCCF